MYKVKKPGYVIGDTAYHCLLEKALLLMKAGYERFGGQLSHQGRVIIAHP